MVRFAEDDTYGGQDTYAGQQDATYDGQQEYGGQDWAQEGAYDESNAWSAMQVTLEDAEHETTPLNSPEKCDAVRANGDLRRPVMQRSGATVPESISAETSPVYAPFSY